MPERKAKIGDRVRLKWGAPKRRGQMATIVGMRSIPTTSSPYRSQWFRYEIRPDGETKILKMAAGHFDVVS